MTPSGIAKKSDNAAMDPEYFISHTYFIYSQSWNILIILTYL